MVALTLREKGLVARYGNLCERDKEVGDCNMEPNFADKTIWTGDYLDILRGGQRVG